MKWVNYPSNGSDEMHVKGASCTREQLSFIFSRLPTFSTEKPVLDLEDKGLWESSVRFMYEFHYQFEKVASGFS